MDSLWHLEHEDGTDWDRAGLNYIVREIRYKRGRIADDFVKCRDVFVNIFGEPVLLDNEGMCWYVYDEYEHLHADMKVVWDD